MNTNPSNDGTKIASDRYGQGPTVILLGRAAQLTWE